MLGLVKSDIKERKKFMDYTESSISPILVDVTSRLNGILSKLDSLRKNILTFKREDTLIVIEVVEDLTKDLCEDIYFLSTKFNANYLTATSEALKIDHIRGKEKNNDAPTT